MRGRLRGGPMPISGGVDLERVRHPREKRVFLASMLVNAAVIALAAALVYFAPEWLSTRPRLSTVVGRIRVAAVAIVLLLPAIGFLRLGHWAAFRENAVRLGRDQVPQLFAILERHCRTLGVDPPELYVSTMAGFGTSDALGLANGRRVIVLGTSLFGGMKDLEDRAEVVSFVLAHELGRLALGHTAWQQEVVLGYLKRIPVLRLPLVSVQTASRDRFAATLAPGCIRGLILLAIGGDLLGHVDPATFVRQVVDDDTPPLWAWVGRLGREGPHLVQRIHDLYRVGFLDVERDLGRRSSGVAQRAPGAPRAEPPRALH